MKERINTSMSKTWTIVDFNGREVTVSRFENGNGALLISHDNQKILIRNESLIRMVGAVISEAASWKPEG